MCGFDVYACVCKVYVLVCCVYVYCTSVLEQYVGICCSACVCCAVCGVCVGLLRCVSVFGVRCCVMMTLLLDRCVFVICLYVLCAYDVYVLYMLLVWWYVHICVLLLLI